MGSLKTTMTLEQYTPQFWGLDLPPLAWDVSGPFNTDALILRSDQQSRNNWQRIWFMDSWCEHASDISQSRSEWWLVFICYT